MHPIAVTPIHVAYPLLKYLCPCLMCCSNKDKSTKNEFEQLIPADSRRATVTIKGKEKKMGKTTHRSKRKTNISSGASHKDPIFGLGFGIVAYRDLLYTMIWAFLGFSLLAAPSMYLFSNGSGYQNLISPGWATESLGNLGYSSV